MALLACLIANANRGSKQAPYAVKDFLLDFEAEWNRERVAEQAEPPAPDGNRLLAMVIGINKVMGGRDLRDLRGQPAEEPALMPLESGEGDDGSP